MLIKTERLILRNYQPADLHDYFKLMTQEKVANRAGFSIKSFDKLSEILKDECRNNLKFAIVLKETNQLVGEIGLAGLDLNSREIYDISYDEYVKEIECCLLEEFWGQNIMTEAMQALVKVGIEMLELDAIVGASYTKNFASKKVQLKCGLMPYKTDKDYIWRETGETCKVILAKITKEQYKHIQARNF